MGLFQSFINFLGRLCLCSIFLLSIVEALGDFRGSEQHIINALCDWLTLSSADESLSRAIEFGLNHSFSLLVTMICFSLLGSGLIIFDIGLRWGALLLLCVIAFSTLLFHHFWTFTEPERHVQMLAFIKNISIAGGVLCLCRQKPSTSEQK